MLNRFSIEARLGLNKNVKNGCPQVEGKLLLGGLFEGKEARIKNVKEEHFFL